MAVKFSNKTGGAYEEMKDMIESEFNRSADRRAEHARLEKAVVEAVRARLRGEFDRVSLKNVLGLVDAEDDAMKALLAFESNQEGGSE